MFSLKFRRAAALCLAAALLFAIFPAPAVQADTLPESGYKAVPKAPLQPAGDVPVTASMDTPDPTEADCVCQTTPCGETVNADCPWCSRDGFEPASCPHFPQASADPTEEECICEDAPCGEAVNAECPWCNQDTFDPTKCPHFPTEPDKSATAGDCVCGQTCAEAGANTGCPWCSIDGQDLTLCTGRTAAAIAVTEKLTALNALYQQTAADPDTYYASYESDARALCQDYNALSQKEKESIASFYGDSETQDTLAFHFARVPNIGAAGGDQTKLWTATTPGYENCNDEEFKAGGSYSAMADQGNLVINIGEGVTGVVLDLNNNTVNAVYVKAGATVTLTNTDALTIPELYLYPGAEYKTAGNVTIGNVINVSNEHTITVFGGTVPISVDGNPLTASNGTYSVEAGKTVTIGDGTNTNYAIVLRGGSDGRGEILQYIAPLDPNYAPIVMEIRGQTTVIEYPNGTFTMPARNVTLTIRSAVHSIYKADTFGVKDESKRLYAQAVAGKPIAATYPVGEPNIDAPGNYNTAKYLDPSCGYLYLDEHGQIQDAFGYFNSFGGGYQPVIMPAYDIYCVLSSYTKNWKQDNNSLGTLAEVKASGTVTLQKSTYTAIEVLPQDIGAVTLDLQTYAIMKALNVTSGNTVTIENGSSDKPVHELYLDYGANLAPDSADKAETLYYQCQIPALASMTVSGGVVLSGKTYALPGNKLTFANAGPETIVVTGAGQEIEIPANGTGEITVSAPCAISFTEKAFEHKGCDVTPADGKEWLEFDASSWESGGFYAMDADVTGTLTIPAGSTLTLCLNGHSLNEVFVAQGGKLTLCDCQKSGTVAKLYESGTVELLEGVTVDEHLYRIFTAENLTIENNSDVYLGLSGEKLVETPDGSYYAPEDEEISIGNQHSLYTLVKVTDRAGNEISSNFGSSFTMPGGPVTLTQPNEFHITDDDSFYAFNTSPRIWDGNSGGRMDYAVYLDADLTNAMWQIPYYFEGTFYGNGRTVTPMPENTIGLYTDCTIRDLVIDGLVSTNRSAYVDSPVSFTCENVTFTGDVILDKFSSMTLSGGGGENLVVYQKMESTVSLGSARYKAHYVGVNYIKELRQVSGFVEVDGDFYFPANVPTLVTGIPDDSSGNPQMLAYNLGGPDYYVRNGTKLTLTEPMLFLLKQATPADHSCNNNTGWIALGGNLAAGQFYYLTSDYAQSVTIPQGGLVTICLNGHTLSDVTIPQGASLSICNCKDSGGVATVNQIGSLKLGSGASVGQTLYGVSNPDGLTLTYADGSGTVSDFAIAGKNIVATVPSGKVLTVKSGGAALEVTDDTTFTMPAAPVTVTARKNETVTDGDSFKDVVDNSGKDTDVEIGTTPDGTLPVPDDYTGDITVAPDVNVTLGGDVGGSVDVGSNSGTKVDGNVGGDVTVDDGGRADVSGDVDGSVAVGSGGTADVSGEAGGVTNNGGTAIVGGVTGDVNNSSDGTTTVGGNVGGNVDVESGTTTVNGTVGGDVDVSGGNADVKKDVIGDVTVDGGGGAEVGGNVGGNVTTGGSGGTTTVGGNVGGSVTTDEGKTEVTGSVDSGVTTNGGNTTVGGDVNDGGVTNNGTTNVTGNVTGGVTTNGGTTTVGKDVTGGITNTGGDTTVNGSVTGNVNVTGGSVDVDGGVDGNVTVENGTADIGGTVTGDITVENGAANVGGTVTGDVTVASGGKLNLGENAEVKGDIYVQPGGNVTVPEGETLPEVYIPAPDLGSGNENVELNVYDKTTGEETSIGESDAVKKDPLGDGTDYISTATTYTVSGLKNGYQVEVGDARYNNGQAFQLQPSDTLEVKPLQYTFVIPKTPLSSSDGAAIVSDAFVIRGTNVAADTRFDLSITGQSEDGKGDTRSGFHLSLDGNGAHTIDYAVAVDGTKFNPAASQEITSSKDEKKLGLTITPDPDTARYAGTYSGILIFQLDLAD